MLELDPSPGAPGACGLRPTSLSLESRTFTQAGKFKLVACHGSSNLVRPLRLSRNRALCCRSLQPGPGPPGSAPLAAARISVAGCSLKTDPGLGLPVGPTEPH